MLKIKPLRNFFKGIQVNDEYAFKTINDSFYNIINFGSITKKINLDLCERHLMSNEKGINTFIEIMNDNINQYILKYLLGGRQIFVKDVLSFKENFYKNIYILKKIFRKILYTIKNKNFLYVSATKIFNDKVMKPFFDSKKYNNDLMMLKKKIIIK